MGCRGRIKVKVVLLLYLYACLWGLVSLSCAGPAWRQKLEVEKHLKRLNKPPIKTIQSSDGDIIDCVHVSHQPAFDHPFLKHHQIQKSPSYHPEGIFGDEKMSEERRKTITQLWHANDTCPEDTIPIRRTKEEDVLRASSVKSFGKKINSIDRHHAVAYLNWNKYYGAKANINVWQPKVQEGNEFSSSQIWVLGGSSSDLNSIEAGWQVNPHLYGDDNTRLFTYWTSDAYQATGCYNLHCSGFIQTNNQIALGGSIGPISDYGRTSQYDITILIWKNPKDGNWWMKFGRDAIIGYWPSFLFSHLADSASIIEWGGEVVNWKPNGQHKWAQMGSGQFPEQGYGKSSFFKNIQVVDRSNLLESPQEVGIHTTQAGCYKIGAWTSTDTAWNTFLYYGGPGNISRCP